jgi:hypothetical protein
MVMFEGGSSIIRRVGGLTEDASGQVSFSVIAVVLLVASAAAGTFIAKQQMDKYEDSRRQQMLDSMEKAISDIAAELSLCAVGRARETMSGWDEFPVNQSAISEAFSDSMRSYISSSFPRRDSRYSSCVTNWTGGLFFVERSTSDIMISDSSRTSELTCDGEVMDYQDLQSPSDDALGVLSVNPYYVAVGNFSVTVSASDVSLSRQSSFQRPVISALPFLESKLRVFESSTEGEFSDLGRMVAYMLTTLAQLRALEGYGQPTPPPGLSTDMMLTEQDVHRAVGVGLLLEQARLFRDIDEPFMYEVAGSCGGGSLGLAALGAERPRSLDPAELFLWFLGMTELDIDAKSVAAQSVYALGDQLIVRMMEYLGWLGTLDAVKDVLDMCVDALASVVSLFTGEDKAHSAVTSWVARTLSASGVDRYAFSCLFSNECDYVIPVPERQYFVEDAAGDLHPVWVGNASVGVDLPVYDLLSSEAWADLYPDFKECQASFTSLVSDSLARLAQDLAAAVELDLGNTSVDPADGQGLFESIASHTGDAELSFDYAALSETWSALPMFSAEHEFARRLSAFVGDRLDDLVDTSGLFRSACLNVAESVLDTARYAYIPDLAVPVRQQLESILLSDVENDESWGVCSYVYSGLVQLCSIQLLRLRTLVEEAVCMSDDGFAGPLVDSVAAVLLSGAEGFPGMAEAIEELMGGLSRSILSQKHMSAFKGSVMVDLGAEFEFWDGDREAAELSDTLLREEVEVVIPGGFPGLRTVQYDPSLGQSSLEPLFPTGDMLVQVRRPWDFDRGDQAYPNTHMTSLGSVNLTPFATQWTVSVLCQLDVELTSRNSVLQSICGEDASSLRRVKVALTFPVLVHTSWPLSGVEYNPSNTVASDAVAAATKFCEVVWDKLEPVFGWVKDGFERVLRFVMELSDTLASFAVRVVKAVSSVMQTVVETLQEYVQKIANSALAKAVMTFIDLTGRVTLRMTLYGFTIIIQTYIPDLIYRNGDDMLRVTVCTDRLGPSISFGIRVARLSDGSWDVLANGTITHGDTRVEVRVDPLMCIMRRFVEVHCVGRTWGMDVMVPEVEPYDLAEVSTADLPGIGALLSNIPIPVLGLSASVEAGLRLKYSPPFPTDVVVNEFESNPTGEDSGREWVELYNPLDAPRCVDGWRLATVHGGQKEMGISGTIPANGVMAFTFPETSIDNGIPDDPFNDGDAIELFDAGGGLVDRTPVCRDSANDERTWQRTWDGGPRWAFEAGSRGVSNGPPVLLASADFIAKALFQAFKQAFLETQLHEVSASLDFLAVFAKRVLNNLIENLLSLVKEIVHEVIFFIKVVVSDPTGSGGLGFRASFVVTGEAIVDLLRWLIFNLATFMVNLGRANNPVAYPPFPTSVFSGLFIRFELLFEVGLPRMMSVIGAVGPLDVKYACAVAISPNVPALGKVAGKSWGSWSVEFGLYLEGVPREFAKGLLSKDTGDRIDFWVVRAKAYGL